jgi:uncharacterized protein (TIGR01440 family)
VDQSLDQELNYARITGDVETIAQELAVKSDLKPGKLLVVGVSTSEVAARPIGTSGSDRVAESIYLGLERVQHQYGFALAFQCCEHLNRALVMERETMERFALDEVSVVPAPKAGGAMASYAFRHLQEPSVVESVRAHAGIDIGDTLIGMHLRPVAVPLRPSIRTIGGAHVNMAYTRPKLIGGARAIYVLESPDTLGTPETSTDA